MANAGDLPDAGKTQGGTGGIVKDPATQANDPGGVATETWGREEGDPEFYMKDIDQKITKIRPTATPIDQISRQASAQHAISFEVEYFSVGTRPITCKVAGEGVVGSSTDASVKLPVDNPTMFTMDDTIRVVGVKGVTNSKGEAYSSLGLTAGQTPDLVLCVCGFDPSSNNPVVYAVNGKKSSTHGNQPILVPAISAGTTLVRMGKACAELDMQTGRFSNIPTPDIQYCQNFMMQIEQSTFDKIAKKEVGWNFSDLEEDALYDMRVTMENSFMFGDKNYIKHISKKSGGTWFTGGIWYMAGKDIEVGKYNSGEKRVVITDNDLVDIARDLFVGVGTGNKRKLLFCGSEFLTALSKIESKKFIYKDTVSKFDLQFKSWQTDFGEVLATPYELFDLNGMSDCAFAMDPEFLNKKTHISWTRHILDLKTAGVRNTDAVVLQEASCLYLRYPKAHARLKLAAAA